MSTPTTRRPASVVTQPVAQPRKASGVSEKASSKPAQLPVAKTPKDQFLGLSKKINTTKEEITKLSGNVTALEKSIQGLQLKAVIASSVYMEKQTQIKEKQSEVARLTAEKQQKESELATLEGEIEALKSGKTQSGWFFNSASPAPKNEGAETSEEAPKVNPEVTKKEKAVTELKQGIVDLTTQIGALNTALGALNTEAEKQQTRASEKMAEAGTKRSEIAPLNLQKQEKEREMLTLEAVRESLTQTEFAKSQPNQSALWWALGYKA